MTKNVASGLGIEYSNFANDWAGVSFSSVRGGTISERDAWITEQDDMIAQCKSKQFRLWLRSFLELSISGSLPMSKFDKFAEHEFRGRRWMWIDPVRDVNAAEKAVKNCWKTNTSVASDMGEDYEDNIETVEREDNAKAGRDAQSIPPLDSNQVTSSIEIMQEYATGAIDADPAVALLTAAGVPHDSAKNMIEKQKVTKSTEGGTA